MPMRRKSRKSRSAKLLATTAIASAVLTTALCATGRHEISAMADEVTSPSAPGVLRAAARKDVGAEATDLVTELGGDTVGAEVSLASIYLSGRMGRPDPVEAAKWVNQAADAGNPYGLYLRLRMREEGLLDEGSAKALEDAGRLVELAQDVPSLKARAGLVVANLATTQNKTANSGAAPALSDSVSTAPASAASAAPAVAATPEAVVPAQKPAQADAAKTKVATEPAAETPKAKNPATSGISSDGLINNLVAGLSAAMPKNTVADVPSAPDAGSKPAAEAPNPAQDAGTAGNTVAPADAGSDAAPALEHSTIVFPDDDANAKPANADTTQTPAAKPATREKVTIGTDQPAKPDQPATKPVQKDKSADKPKEKVATKSTVAPAPAAKPAPAAATTDTSKKVSSSDAASKAPAIESVAASAPSQTPIGDAPVAGEVLHPKPLSELQALKKAGQASGGQASTSGQAPAAQPAGGQPSTGGQPANMDDFKRMVAEAQQQRDSQAGSPGDTSKTAPAKNNLIALPDNAPKADTGMDSFKQMVAQAQAQRDDGTSAAKSTGDAAAGSTDQQADAAGSMKNSAGQVLQEIPQPGQPTGAVMQSLQMAQNGTTPAAASNGGSPVAEANSGALFAAKSSSEDALYTKYNQVLAENRDAMDGLDPQVKQVRGSSGWTNVLMIYGFKSTDQLNTVCGLFNVKNCVTR